MTKQVLQQALESMCWAARVMNINPDEAPEYFRNIESLKALAQQGEQPPLSTTEVLRVTPEGEFIWAENADEAIEHGDFTASPAMRHILKALRGGQVKQQPVAWYDEEMDEAYTATELDGGNTDGLILS